MELSSVCDFKIVRVWCSGSCSRVEGSVVHGDSEVHEDNIVHEDSRVHRVAWYTGTVWYLGTA